MDLGLAGRAYVVTGASRGLGRATAEALVAEGASVLLTGRHRESLEAAAAELGERACVMVADNADPQTAERVVAAGREHFGTLHGGLISVGGPPAGTVLDTPDDAWVGAFESVFLGAVRLCRALADAMVDGRSDGGSIALVLSTSVRQPVPGLTISNGLRPGLAMVAKSLADEVGPRGVRVNGLLPGRVDTDRVRELDEATGDAEAARLANTQQVPLRRYGRPEEFGAVAAFVLSPAAGYLNGVMIPVDGGLTRSL